MNTNPYNPDDLENFLSRIPESNIPQLLQLILFSRDYEKLTDSEKESLIAHINLINNLDPNFNIAARNKIINGLRVKIKNEDRSLARAVFQNRINELEQSKIPILDFERLISTKFSERYLEETIKYEWGKVNSHYKYINEWKYIFSKISFYKGDLPDESFDIFRAGTKEGLSWTTEISIAKWFYNKNLISNEKEYNYFLKLNVSKTDVLFYQNHRNENEVVHIPNLEKIEFVSEEEIKNIPTINSPRNKRIAKGEL
ncbi:MAG: hypothetical protein CL772_05125 [Chloroflexi bacterium]|nr:hypothetical protein [Chloroflexota bacterium]|tara:strand:+ start:622 stop:1389 length:768 start_codon:yes stop_codon:yes gene_type:complete